MPIFHFWKSNNYLIKSSMYQICDEFHFVQLSFKETQINAWPTIAQHTKQSNKRTNKDKGIASRGNINMNIVVVIINIPIPILIIIVVIAIAIVTIVVPKTTMHIIWANFRLNCKVFIFMKRFCLTYETHSWGYGEYYPKNWEGIPNAGSENTSV